MKKILKETNLEDTIQLASDVSKLYDELQKDKVDYQRLKRRKGRLVTKPSLTLFHMAAKRGYLSVCHTTVNDLPNQFALVRLGKKLGFCYTLTVSNYQTLVRRPNVIKTFICL